MGFSGIRHPLAPAAARAGTRLVVLSVARARPGTVPQKGEPCMMCGDVRALTSFPAAGMGDIAGLAGSDSSNGSETLAAGRGRKRGSHGLDGGEAVGHARAGLTRRQRLTGNSRRWPATTAGGASRHAHEPSGTLRAPAGDDPRTGQVLDLALGNPIAMAPRVYPMNRSCRPGSPALRLPRVAPCSA